MTGRAVSYDGSAWSTPANVDPGGDLESVSCPVAAFCAAVDSAGNAVVETAGTWRKPDLIDAGNALWSVSCELLGDVADRRDHVLVTRNGKPAAALVPIDEYEALEETADVLSGSATLSAIEAGLADLARGDSITLEELRQELAQRRPAR
jgi:prevent-host-death family protein